MKNVVFIVFLISVCQIANASVMSGYVKDNCAGLLTNTEIFFSNESNTTSTITNESGFYDIDLNEEIDYSVSIIVANKNWLPKTLQFDTSACYQETANYSTDCGLDTGSYSSVFDNNIKYNYEIFLTNYSKPSDAINTSLWTVKHGVLDVYNISIPTACWNQEPLQFGIWSDYNGGDSQPVCYNGSAWIDIGTYNVNGSCPGWGNTVPFENLIDGNWNTWGKGSTTGSWVTGGDGQSCDGAKVYEEAMWWVIPTNITLSRTYCPDYNPPVDFPKILFDITGGVFGGLTSVSMTGFLIWAIVACLFLVLVGMLLGRRR